MKTKRFIIECLLGLTFASLIVAGILLSGDHVAFIYQGF